MADGASFVYNTEPPTRGKIALGDGMGFARAIFNRGVVIVTTCGELDVELWPKETPMACRNFIQLYFSTEIYNQTISFSKESQGYFLEPIPIPAAVSERCLEGYYDNNIFHRIVQNFMVQTGDPTGTGEGGESIYGKPFKNEVHSRLRFRHRGIIATANSGKNDNGSQ
eukprot:1239804-Amorphochlora_amoeboformis.AAC.2